MVLSPDDIRQSRRYRYYRTSERRQKLRHELEAEDLSRDILYPTIRDPNFLVLRERRRIFSEFVHNIPEDRLRVLDVGGRLQPYRLLLNDHVELYAAVDPMLEGLVNVLAVGESLPFPDNTFNFVICTQVLNYSVEPFRMISEIHRVLRKGAFLFLSVPAIFPCYHDQRWRFMPEGILTLLSSFSDVKIFPEGFSIAGFLRTINLFFDTFVVSTRMRALVASTIFPTTNVVGLLLDRLSHGKTQFTTNYSCVARKSLPGPS
jgi:SAM-dependent methyltransferase